ncbi:hypothetical protein KFK09_005544 [Dendrobium nobile]|uniref:Uncharacterized protein n=1 Tax=Dendrobium nobile TaxID=94219 RepID=A0A8T3BW36_DENNO|nr:hypothetical protein KFK09_005544 [Dendrobium nobile]
MEVGRTIVGDGGRKDRSRQETGGQKDRCLLMEVGRTIVGDGGRKDSSWQYSGRTVGIRWWPGEAQGLK